MVEINKYLPIGSIVKLEGGIKRIMIAGIFQASKKDHKIIEEYDYIGVLFPEGFISYNTMVLFNHSQIEEVVFRGFEDSERSEFIEAIYSSINSIYEAENN